ncbi:MAG: protoporphyrinogen oxidase HemJ [Rhodospirillaceae bacterium]|nr:MAG: protoporphyrinogen oxidase HemJ [Rhodospirillaceae bacterium]
MFLWIKALHVVAVISWMAGLLYLPRLFVYHAGVAAGSETATLLATMERRLLTFIMRPASVVVLLTGGALISAPGVVDWSMAWMPVKLVCVLGLFGAHGAMESWTRKFATGANTKSPRFYRIVNEVPTLLMIVIVAMVIAKPF